MKATSVIIGVAVALMALVGAASADTVFSEDFETMTTGVVFEQNGWYRSGWNQTANVNVGNTGELTGMQVLGGDVDGVAAHSISSLDPTKVTTVTVDAQWLGSDTFGSSPLELGYVGHAYQIAVCTSDVGWYLDTRGFMDNSASLDWITGGTTGVQSFKIEIDGPAGTLDAYYDFGSGYTLWASKTGIPGTNISALNLVTLQMNGGAGVAADNILIGTTLPEPSMCALLAIGAIGLLAYAWRKRR